MRRSMSAQALGVMVAAAVLMMISGTGARAGTTQPELSVQGGTGVPGGTVAVTLSLADDTAGAAVSAGVDLNFDPQLLQFFEPVADSCAVANRISTTHGVAGRLGTGSDHSSPPLNLEVFVLGSPSPLPPLGNGELVTCDFRIKEGAPVGTTDLDIEAPLLGDADGQPIPVRVTNGSVNVVAALPTDTPTQSPTPQVTDTATPQMTDTATPQMTDTATPQGTDTATPEVTATDTVGVTPTATATNTGATPTATATRTTTSATATATNTPGTRTATATATRTGGGPTPTKKGADSDSCNIVPPDPSATPGSAALLLLPALLLWMRRRDQ
ncbi:MAG TPA: hypothetical protein VL049_06860 [Candidatus Dormibacteraeota bacterium]|nr:hypothetical protein [Candidatus Dormibacteraeota bacterium]